MSSWAPNETASTLFLERTFVSGDVITGTGYGIQLMLYLACARYLWNQRQKRKLQPLFLLAYITVLILVETVYVAVQHRTIQDMYVDNRNYPGGPWQYFLATQYLPENVIFIATLFILTFLSDILVLWRCWVIWAASGQTILASLAVAFPALVLIGSFVVGVLWAHISSQPGLSLYSNVPIIYGTCYYALSLGVNVMLTVLIAARLLAYRRKVVSVLAADHGSYYLSLASIFVESAALYTVCALLFLITYAVDSPINQVFLGMTNSGQQIATYLIIYRIAEGSGFSRSAIESTTLNTNGKNRPEVKGKIRSLSIDIEAVVVTEDEDRLGGHVKSDIS